MNVLSDYMAEPFTMTVNAIGLQISGPAWLGLVAIGALTFIAYTYIKSRYGGGSGSDGGTRVKVGEVNRDTMGYTKGQRVHAPA